MTTFLVCMGFIVLAVAAGVSIGYEVGHQLGLDAGREPKALMAYIESQLDQELKNSRQAGIRIGPLVNMACSRINALNKLVLTHQRSMNYALNGPESNYEEAQPQQAVPQGAGAKVIPFQRPGA